MELFDKPVAGSPRLDFLSSCIVSHKLSLDMALEIIPSLLSLGLLWGILAFMWLTCKPDMLLDGLKAVCLEALSLSEASLSASKLLSERLASFSLPSVWLPFTAESAVVSLEYRTPEPPSSSSFLFFSCIITGLLSSSFEEGFLASRLSWFNWFCKLWHYCFSNIEENRSVI